MLSLADTQRDFRRAIVIPEDPVRLDLVAPTALCNRLAIYRRHYREGLSRHLRGRFPTIEWLLGSPRMVALAERFVRVSPPVAPCLAEYGDDFVAFVAGDPSGASLPYLADTAHLDWHLGNVSVAIDRPPLAISMLSEHAPEHLPDLVLTLQPGLRYLASSWPIDDLVRVRLGDAVPERLAFDPMPVALQLRGARGQFGIERLSQGAFAFRSALAVGAPLGAAAEAGLAADPQFDISSALAALFGEGLVTTPDT